MAACEPPFERFFATPQKADIGKLCEGMGVDYRRLEGSRDLAEALREPPSAGVRVWEIRTDRKADRETMTRLLRPSGTDSGASPKRS